MENRVLRIRREKREPSPFPSDVSDSEDTPSPVHSPKRPPKKRAKAERPTASLFEDDDAERGARAQPLGRAWNPEEDKVLLDAVKSLGPRWQEVEKQCRRHGYDRSQAMCRNRYQRIMAPLKEGKGGKNKCKRCFQIKKGHICTAVEDVVVHRSLPAEVAAAAAREASMRLATPPPAAAAHVAAAVAATVLAPATAPVTPPVVVTSLSSRPRLGRPRAPPNPNQPSPYTPVVAMPPMSSISTSDLPDHSLLSPVSGNDFKIDVDSFLEVVSQREAANRPPLGSLASLNASATEEAAGVSAAAAAGLLAPCVVDTGAADAPAPPPLLASTSPPLAGSPYLMSAGPPPIAPPMKPSNSFAAVSFGNVSVSSIISDRADLVDISDLESAADAALAASSAASSFASGAEGVDGRADGNSPSNSHGNSPSSAHTKSSPSHEKQLAALQAENTRLKMELAEETRAQETRALEPPSDAAIAAIAAACMGTFTRALPPNASPVAAMSVTPNAAHTPFTHSIHTSESDTTSAAAHAVGPFMLLSTAPPLSAALSRSQSPLPVEIEISALHTTLEPMARTMSYDSPGACAVATPPMMAPWSSAPSFSFAEAHGAAHASPLSPPPAPRFAGIA